MISNTDIFNILTKNNQDFKNKKKEVKKKTRIKKQY